MNDISKINVFNNESIKFTKNIILKINNNIYNPNFDLDVVIEKEAVVNITLYNFLPQKNLQGLEVKILIDDICIFDGKVQKYNLEQNSKMQMLINLECRQEVNALESIKKSKLISKGTTLKEIIPNNLGDKIILQKDITLLEHDTLGKLDLLREELNLPYFSIKKDKINFVDFNSKANKIKNIFKAIVNKTVDNFEYIQMVTQFNEDIYTGDIIFFDDNLYAIETVVYSWSHKKGFFQEIYAINKELHRVRYLK